MTTLPAMAKLLSLWSPWWWYCLHSTKRRENRGWRTNHRGPLYVHAALKSEGDVAQVVKWASKQLPPGAKKPDEDELWAARGHIVGKVNVTGCELNTASVCLRDMWAAEGQYGILFDQPEVLAQPIPWKGAQGLVEVQPDQVAVVEWMASQPVTPVASPTTGALDLSVPLPFTLKALVGRCVGAEVAEDVAYEWLLTRLTALVGAGQLTQEGTQYRTRPSPILGRAPRQQGLGW